MKTMKTMISAIALTAIAGAASAGEFAELDANADGKVNFEEYKAVALESGKTATLAAQEFTSMTEGDAVLTEDEFLIAEATASTEAETSLFSAPLTDNAIETVAPVATFESYPAEAEAMSVETDTETSVEAEADMSGTMESESMTSETEMDIESDVAGEVATSDDMISIDPAAPIVETPELGLDLETEADAESDIALDVQEDDIDIPQAPELPEDTSDIY